MEPDTHSHASRRVLLSIRRVLAGHCWTTHLHSSILASRRGNDDGAQRNARPSRRFQRPTMARLKACDDADCAACYAWRPCKHYYCDTPGDHSVATRTKVPRHAERVRRTALAHRDGCKRQARGAARRAVPVNIACTSYVYNTPTI